MDILEVKIMCLIIELLSQQIQTFSPPVIIVTSRMIIMDCVLGLSVVLCPCVVISANKKRNGKYYCCGVCQQIAETGSKPYPCLCTTERLKFGNVEDYYKHMKRNNQHENQEEKETFSEDQ